MTRLAPSLLAALLMLSGCAAPFSDAATDSPATAAAGAPADEQPLLVLSNCYHYSGSLPVPASSVAAAIPANFTVVPFEDLPETATLRVTSLMCQWDDNSTREFWIAVPVEVPAADVAAAAHVTQHLVTLHALTDSPLLAHEYATLGLRNAVEIAEVTQFAANAPDGSDPVATSGSTSAARASQSNLALVTRTFGPPAPIEAQVVRLYDAGNPAPAMDVWWPQTAARTGNAQFHSTNGEPMSTTTGWALDRNDRFNLTIAQAQAAQ